MRLFCARLFSLGLRHAVITERQATYLGVSNWAGSSLPALLSLQRCHPRPLVGPWRRACGADLFRRFPPRRPSRTDGRGRTRGTLWPPGTGHKELRPEGGWSRPGGRSPPLPYLCKPPADATPGAAATSSGRAGAPGIASRWQRTRAALGLPTPPPAEYRSPLAISSLHEWRRRPPGQRRHPGLLGAFPGGRPVKRRLSRQLLSA